MSKFTRKCVPLVTALILICTGASPAFAGVRKNELGMFTVKCQVVKNGPGNPIVGLVYGNHKKDHKAAERDADQYTSKFGSNVHKRHCDTQSRYKRSGAFTVSGEPI